MIVADTCLIYYLCNDNDLTPKAQHILEKDPYWIVPSLWRKEYANVLSKLARKEHRSIEEVIEHFNDTVTLFEESERPVEMEQALRISIAHKLSVYDAHFVTLAFQHHVFLITEDKEVLKRCPELAINMDSYLRL